jgi:hypothetical protein
MDTFRWIGVIFSMILGLGVTRLLAGGVSVFRARHRARIDWLPLAWAFGIFLSQLDYWWSILELPKIVSTWTFGIFAILVSLTLLLFVAAALVLPADELKEGDDLGAAFATDGRFALIALAAYWVLAALANEYVWGAPIVFGWGLLAAAEIALPLIVFAAPSRQVRGILTIVFLIIAVWEMVLSARTTY